jgi:hypothetical protein
VDLKDVVAFIGTRNLTLRPNSWHALQQIYGYMTFNNTRYGILTNWERALFLRRTKVDGRNTLDVYSVEPDWRSTYLDAESVGRDGIARRGRLVYATPTLSSAPPNRTFGTSTTAPASLRRAIDNAQRYRMQPVNGTYKDRTLDFRHYHFDLSTARRVVRLVLPSSWA